MARSLKTFITTQGFFDQAVAAPSMKAALEAFGVKHNLFHQGFAKETDDSEIVAATMEAPGVVLKRPVGSDDTFKKHAELPNSIISEVAIETPKEKKTHRKGKKLKQPKQTPTARDREAAKHYEREEKRRQKERQREAARRESKAKRFKAAVAKAIEVLQEEEKRHRKVMMAFRKQQSALDEKIDAEEIRWEKQQKRLEDSIKQAEEK